MKINLCLKFKADLQLLDKALGMLKIFEQFVILVGKMLINLDIFIDYFNITQYARNFI